jgi:hypothetical protein
VGGTSGIPNGTNLELLVNGTVVKTKAFNNGQALFDGADAAPINVQGSVTLEARAVGAANINPAQISITVDTVAPVAVDDLSCDLVNAREGSVNCSFTAPQDPAPGTGAKKYEVRLSAEVVINEANFAQAQIVAVPNAGAAGSQEVVTFTGARPGATYHVALVSLDAAQNRSLVSNDAGVKIGGVVQEVRFSDFTFTNPDAAGGFFGAALDRIGDFNGDGFDDVAIAAPFAGPGGSDGEVYLYYGGADPAVVFAAPAAVIRGNAGSLFGNSIVGVGDFDGDTIDDLAVSAPFDLQGASSGVVFVFRGRSGAQEITGLRAANQADYIIRNDPTQGISTFGNTLGAPGDLDNDGLSDLLIGAPGALSGAGAAYVLYGRDLPTPRTVTLPQDLGAEMVGTGADAFGFAVTGPGDLNNDGFDDIAIGAPQLAIDTFDDTGPGLALVFLGGPRPLIPPIGAQALDAGDAFAVINGNGANIDFGFTLAGVGSLDGDNKPSLAVADPSAQTALGRLFLFDDVNLGTIASINATTVMQGVATLSFGNSIAPTAAIGGRGQADVDGDGFPDLLTLSFAEGALAGDVFLFYGGDTIFAAANRNSNTADLIQPPPLGADALDTVRAIGDINADGFIDFAFGCAGVDLVQIVF